jgi:hypothetical protein
LVTWKGTDAAFIYAGVLLLLGAMVIAAIKFPSRPVKDPA